MTYDPEEYDGCEAVMSTLTNEEWLRTHRALIDSGALPVEQLAYLYDPDRDPSTVTVDELSVDHDPKEPPL